MDVSVEKGVLNDVLGGHPGPQTPAEHALGPANETIVMRQQKCPDGLAAPSPSLGQEPSEFIRAPEVAGNGRASLLPILHVSKPPTAIARLHPAAWNNFSSRPGSLAATAGVRPDPEKTLEKISP